MLDIFTDRISIAIISVGLGLGLISGLGSCKNKKPEQTDPMSKAYWEFWNPEVQASIDKDIEQYRKAEAILKFDRLSAGTEAKVEQISHDFIYDANIFIFYILGSNELNDKYKDLFGTLFNSATIPFYWKKFEIKPDSLRFNEEYWDTEEYWNQVEDPNSEPHWRRPAPEPILEFCESKGIRKHGHPITWGENKWHYPEWIYEEFWPEDEKEKINGAGENGLDSLTPARIENLVPVYCSEINRLFRKRIIELIDYYGGRLES